MYIHIKVFYDYVLLQIKAAPGGGGRWKRAHPGTSATGPL